MGWGGIRQYYNPSMVLKKISNPIQIHLLKFQTHPIKSGTNT